MSLVGFGLMGSQIAQVISSSGIRVVAYDVREDLLSRGLDLIRNGKYGFEASVAKSRISREDANRAFWRITTTTSLEKALDHAQFVLEAVVEDLTIKRDIFRKASEIADPASVLATNTSTLSISQIGSELRPKDRSRVAGMHFFNPPQLMKLVEIVRTKKTSEATVAKISAIALYLGKTPIVEMDYPGFVANRIGISVFAEASEILDKGVSNVRDIDLAMRLGYGYPMGPFELGDLVGLDARLQNMQALFQQTKDERFKPPKLLKKLVRESYFGDPKSKPGSKGGYYEYFQMKRPSEE